MMTYRNKRHIRKHLVLVMAVLATILISCSTNRQKGLTGVLATVDSMTNATQYNDSAISLLEQVRDSMLRQDEVLRMAYKLMCVKAYDRARQPYDGEDEIPNILEYYENKGDKAMLPVALYYAGRHSAKQNDAPSALRYFHRAHELIASDSANVLNGWICSQSGYLYSQQMLYEESRRFFEDGYRYGIASKDTMSMIYSIRDIGGSYQMVGDKATCDTCLHKALRLAEAKRDTMMIRNILCSLTDNNIEMVRYDSAKVYLRPLLKNIYRHEESAIYTNATRIYYHLNQPDSALYYIEKVLDVGTIQGKTTAYRNRTRIDLMRGDVAAARGDFENYVLCIDSVNRITASEALAKASAIYDYSMKEQENARLQEENQKKSWWAWLSTLACVALLALLLLGDTFRKKRRAEDNARSIALESGLNDTRKSRQDLQKEKEALKEGLSLPEVEYDMPPSYLTKWYEARKVMDNCLAENRLPTEQEWHSFEEKANEIYPKFMAKLISRTKLSEIEKRVCWLVRMKVAPSDIASLVSRTPQGITSIRSRLFKKLFKIPGNGRDFDDYIGQM